MPGRFGLYDVKDGELGENEAEKTATVQVHKATAWLMRHHDFVELLRDTLPADNLYPLGIALQSRKGLVVDIELKLCGKPDTTQHPQRVVAESDVGVKRCADDAVFQS